MGAMPTGTMPPGIMKPGGIIIICKGFTAGRAALKVLQANAICRICRPTGLGLAITMLSTFALPVLRVQESAEPQLPAFKQFTATLPPYCPHLRHHHGPLPWAAARHGPWRHHARLHGHGHHARLAGHGPNHEGHGLPRPATRHARHHRHHLHSRKVWDWQPGDRCRYRERVQQPAQ